MFKKIEVVMLPTTKKSLIHSYMYRLGLRDKPLSSYPMNGNSQISYAQHLYFLSDEKVKEGDYAYYPSLYEVLKVDKSEIYEKGKQLKVIATTDKSITIPATSSGRYVYHLPQPSQAFVEKFVEEYNKGNVISEVMVEYEKNCPYDFTSSCTVDRCKCELKLKVNPKDNTITIKRVKDNWNREEVIAFAEKYARMVQEKEIQLNAYKAIHNKRWIEENL